MSGIASPATPRGPAKRQPPRQNPQSKVILYALVSLGSFLLALVLIALMIWKADALTRFGLVGHVYFAVIVVLGLVAAAFLFGVLRSHASYRGQHLGGVLQLGGPAVVFALVVVGGKVLVSDRTTFPLTVYVQDPRRPQEIVLRNSGEVFVDLGGDRRHVPIGDQGQAYFPAIPANFLEQPVRVGIESDKFESVEPNKTLKLGESGVYLAVRRKDGRIYGRVDSKEPSCLPHAEVRVAGQVASVDPNSGQFEVTVPGDRMGDDLFLVASSPNCIQDPDKQPAVPNSNGMVVTLKPKAPATRTK